METNLTLGKVLGNHEQGHPGADRCTESQVSGVSPHHYDVVPASRGPGVFHQMGEQPGGVLPGGLEAEGGNAGGEWKIVVDGLGDVGNSDAPLGLFGDTKRREGGVVTADGDEVIDTELVEAGDHAIEILGALGGIRPGSQQDRAAERTDPRDVRDFQGDGVAGVALHQPAEALPDAVHLGAVSSREDGGRSDHSVDSGGRPASHQDSERRHAIALPGPPVEDSRQDRGAALETA